MYLKSLEIQGFKSFPDKLHLDFHKGMTAIVGPNGSGKSNIADAVRWVLGEQSTKTLRGSKMEDVIFAGTQSRKPVGYAEVSLTLDNTEQTLKTEYTEVTVTRRFYRSGDSEFLLNRKLVRLKDIHELFMDTGLGRDGYSIIGQGRIDEILSIKSDERREVFDEAAGITKFRYRSDEAMKRLDAANENLVRINDIVAELENQIDPLKKKAEKERKYNELYMQLKKLEISLWMEKLDELSQALEKVSADRNVAAFGSQECKMKIDNAYKENEFLSAKLIALEKQMDDKRISVRECEGENTEIIGTINLKKAEISRNERDIQRLRMESADYDKRHDELCASILQKENKIDEDKLHSAQIESEIAVIFEKSSAQRQKANEAAHSRSAMYEREQTLRAHLSDCLVEISSLMASSDEICSHLSKINQKDQSDKLALDDAKQKIDLLSDKLEKMKSKYDGQKNVILGHTIKVNARKKKAEEVNLKYANTLRELNDGAGRLKMLIDLQRDYEGFNRAVKLVMRDMENHSLSGIHGPISKLMHAPDEYVVAAETALGAAIQNIVVEREEDAKSAIEMLKRRDGGRATFLPITAIKGTELSDGQLCQERGFIGILSHLVTYEPRYRDIFNNLLGRTVVCENMDAAIAMSRKNGYKFRIVTLDGQVINSGGAMTGGSQNKSYGILTRANEIERLTVEQENMQKRITDDETELKNIQREITAADYSLEAARNEQHSLETELAVMTSELRQMSESYELMKRGIENADDTNRELSERLLEIKVKISAKTDDKNEINAEIKSVLEAFTDIDNEAKLMSDTANEFEHEAAIKNNELVELRLGIQAQSAALVELRAHLESVIEDKMRRIESIETFCTMSAQLTCEVEELEKNSAALQKKIQITKGSIEKTSEQKMRTEGEKVKNERIIQSLNSQALNLERELLRLENQIENINHEQDTLTSKLWDTYELTRTSAREHCIELINKAQDTKNADELRKSIKALGSIYPGAIEEYAEVSQRYEFMSAQRRDIELSQKSLITVINELTEKMKTLFSQQFKIINELFGKTFVEMFGGGHAHIELSDPKDILGSGIEIKVQPPGKALKVLSLLSGGEKAFVAIALYFSILQVRPTPFCVLDEIEAALDDVNVSRFAKYLKNFKNTQFIVITHRRGTMEEADMLYGVAMPMQGVSKVLSLNIESVEKDMAI